MDTNAKDRNDKIWNEDTEAEYIRCLLLQAEEEEYRQARSKAPPAPPYSRAYRRWEKRFLRACAGKKRGLPRGSVPAPLRAAASFLLVVFCALLLTIGMNPNARAAVAESLGFVSQMETPGINVTVDLGGRGGSVYTSERFRCDKSNGNTLYYAFENHGEEACTLRLYQVGFFQTKCVGEVVTIEPGERNFGMYSGLKGNAYFLRVSSVMGGKIHGALQTSQGSLK